MLFKRGALGAISVAGACCVYACTSTAGGPVLGPVDDHCYAGDAGFQSQLTLESSCTPDAGTFDAGMPSGPEYGPTQYNSEANDDDCKYQVGWWSTPISQGANVTLYFSVVRTADGTPVTGAAADNYAEIFLNDHHPAPNTHRTTTEQTADGGAGVYAIGPVVFDASGEWTVRFHIRADCEDLLPTSPHGHAAFYVEVP